MPRDTFSHGETKIMMIYKYIYVILFQLRNTSVDYSVPHPIYIHISDLLPPPSFSTDHFKAVLLLQFFLRQWFHLWHLFCHYLFLISPSAGATGRLGFVIVAFLCIFTYVFDTSDFTCISFYPKASPAVRVNQ